MAAKREGGVGGWEEKNKNLKCFWQSSSLQHSGHRVGGKYVKYNLMLTVSSGIWSRPLQPNMSIKSLPKKQVTCSESYKKMHLFNCLQRILKGNTHSSFWFYFPIDKQSKIELPICLGELFQLWTLPWELKLMRCYLNRFNRHFSFSSYWFHLYFWTKKSIFLYNKTLYMSQERNMLIYFS